MDYFEKVKEFHIAFGAPAPETPTLYPCKTDKENKDLHKLRYDLIAEELEEFKTALNNNDIVEVLDSIEDLIYVCVGAAVSFGLPLNKGFEEVHSSNMSKLGEDGKPIRRSDGKIMKGPNYFRPNLKPIIESSK